MKKQTKILVLVLGMILLLSGVYAGISLTAEKEIILDKHIVDNLNEIGFGVDYKLTPCVIIDEIHCKFIAYDHFFFDDFRPELSEIEYKGKTKEQINEEMKDNVKEMLIFYSDKLDYEKSIEEEVKVYVSDEVIINVKEEK